MTPRCQLARYQHRGTGDEAIEHDDAALRSRLEHGTDHRGDLESTEGVQRRQQRVGFGPR